MKTSGGIYYEEQGNGNVTLLFVHYFGGSLRSWRDVVTNLSDSFHCIMLDLPGFGNSDAPSHALSVDQQSELILALIREKSLMNYTLVGHSMGGKIVLDLASKQPPGLHAVVLIAPSPPSPEPMTDSQRITMLDTFADRDAIEKLVHKITVADLDPKLFAATVADHLKISHTAWDAWLLKGSQEDLQPDMWKVIAPLYLVSGESDPMFSTAYLKETFSRQFSLHDFVEVKNTGHLIPIEQAVSLASIIRFFHG